MNVYTLPLGPLAANCYVFADDDGNGVVIDPGTDSAPLRDLLREHVRTLHYILLTHGHADHIGGAAAMRETTGAPIAIGALDSPYTDSALCMAADIGMPFTPFRADILLQEGDTVDFASHSLRVLHTPGHTPGGVCYLDEPDRLLFTGDTLFCLTAGRTDFPGGSHQQMLESLTRLRNLEGDYTVYPGHERATTLAHERVRNLFMRRLGDRR